MFSANKCPNTPSIVAAVHTQLSNFTVRKLWQQEIWTALWTSPNMMVFLKNREWNHKTWHVSDKLSKLNATVLPLVRVADFCQPIDSQQNFMWQLVANKLHQNRGFDRTSGCFRTTIFAFTDVVFWQMTRLQNEVTGSPTKTSSQWNQGRTSRIKNFYCKKCSPWCWLEGMLLSFAPSSNCWIFAKLGTDWVNILHQFFDWSFCLKIKIKEAEEIPILPFKEVKEENNGNSLKEDNAQLSVKWRAFH